MAMIFESGVEASNSQTSNQGRRTTQRMFDQTAIDKLIYDVLASDRGLASLASGENLSGGFNSSAKTLQTQDFLTKLIGELAIASAPEVVTENKSESNQQQKGKTGLKTVICTELVRQGLLDRDLYDAGNLSPLQPSHIAWLGYYCWAVHVVTQMQKSPALSRALLPIVQSRYRYLTGAPGANILGRLTVHVGQPICYLIGTVINLRGYYGRTNESA